MKIDYFFPIFENDNIENITNIFFNSQFFKKNGHNNVVFCCYDKDKNNLAKLKKICGKNKNFILLIFNERFSYNDAFTSAIENFTGDFVLLGDCRIQKLELVFQKCLEKKQQEINVVHVVKRYHGIKDFFGNFLHGIYNFFVKIFTNKKDRINVVSLGLIDKDVLDLLKVLPKKRCFLKNTKDMLGFETRTVYIDGRTTTYKPNFKEKTKSIKITYISTAVLFISLLLTIILNSFIKVPVWVNIIFCAGILAGLILISIFLPKHFFDIRNFPSNNENFKIKRFEKEKQNDR